MALLWIASQFGLHHLGLHSLELSCFEHTAVHLLALQLRNVCRCLAMQSLRNPNCSRSIDGALCMVVGLVGLCGFGAKSKLVVLYSRVLAGSDPATTKPCPVPFGALFAPAGSGVARMLCTYNLNCMVAAGLIQLPGKCSDSQDQADQL